MSLTQEKDVNVVSTGENCVSKPVVISYINTLKGGTNSDSFITPTIALKIVDFIYLNKFRNPIQSENADEIVHRWYKEPITDKKVLPYHQRTKTIDQLISFATTEFQLTDATDD